MGLGDFGTNHILLMWNGDASQMMFNKQKQCQLPVYQPSFIHHVSIQCIYVYICTL